MNIYTGLVDKKNKGVKSFAVLLDPDNLDEQSCMEIIDLSCGNVDYFFAGGSLLIKTNLNAIVQTVKNNCDIPVILFPGNNLQIYPSADAILLLSLISGRNPDMLIGQHVVAAPILKKSSLEILPTGYMLVDCGKQTTAQYISNTMPIPYNKNSLASCTAIAGEMLGLKLIYLDGGSGAGKPINPAMINAVRRSVDVPIIAGGGINSAEKALEALNAGADLIVIGNGIEEKPGLLVDVSQKVKEMNRELV
ncbi:MAG: geranylgeranylglyceryl/heptaprenylglyceryl phosphate synthase [Cytophagales bacterium]|nr:geranylgeranylglyceryl/heptaprenylglyceryl phosphate synthase [Cytophagales bacterium]